VIVLTLTGCDGGTQISGTVQDPAGKPVANATIQLINREKVVKEWSREDGSFHIAMLHAPFKTELKLSVTKDGYRPFEKHFYSTDHLESIVVILDEVFPKNR
jgi:hypothetical protein